MTWDSIGALGEIIGASAVVISVVYLAVQIRRQTDQARLTASRELADSWNQSIGQPLQDENYAALYLRAARDYESMPSLDRMRITSHFFQMMRTTEQQQLHVKLGHLDPSFFESSDRAFMEWLRLPGVQQWWVLNREHFSDEFAQNVDGRIIQAKAKGYSSTFKLESETLTKQPPATQD
ncbi:MAG: hypothetical protein ACU84Q_13480 [Gammaproteobacteria bacterium]